MNVESLEIDRAHKVRTAQVRAHRAEGPPSAATRIDRINRLKSLLIDNRERLCEAVREDYGERSSILSLFGEIQVSIEQINAALKTQRLWFKREQRSSPIPFRFLGAKSWVSYEPLGVVGNMAPWNFPIQTALGPVGDIFAAGNRCMVKPSEHTPNASALIHELVSTLFDDEELAIIQGGVTVSKAFAALPWDHLLVTGSTQTGKAVMAAAAENLTPVTLELGGKCPVVVDETAKLELAFERIMFMKGLNAGQVCLAPDYLLLQESIVEASLHAARAATAKLFPKIKANDQYANILGERNTSRLKSLLQDAEEKGAQLHPLNPANETFDDNGLKIPPTLVLNVTPDMAISVEEIFGPIFPVMTWRTTEDLVAILNDHEPPLAINYFGQHPARKNALQTNTRSGAFSINTVAGHFLNPDLPFGGVGASGMGRYHGVDGFKAFSNARAFYKQTSIPFDRMLMPPWNAKFKKTLEGMLK